VIGAAASAWIGLGSNLDDPASQLRGAFGALERLPGTRLVRRSALYRTPPWGDTAQPDFVNAVAEIATLLPPRDLLDALLAIEADSGRVRARRWGPRVLDLDLLLYADRVIKQAGLVVPHPHLHERAFVLLPLADVAPQLQVPGAGRVADLLDRVDRAGCERLADA
jgi:2-amino-4-hydroxy-6-hydroxymethyldihydropteridine diphosphokinase